ncbi:MAG: CHASE2 domain-containing protein [Synechococcales bacterium]|nr:CHASE2 domain-containing protein [Synechococcales bacterium]
MDRLVVLELEGNFQAGFLVVLDIRAESERTLLKVRGSLPPAPEVARQLQAHWQDAYRSLGLIQRIKGQKIIHKGSLNQRLATCRRSAVQLRDCFQTWLNAPSFLPIDRRLREELNRTDPIRFLLRTDDPNLQRLPWSEWDFFLRYPKAELALSPAEYETRLDCQPKRTCPTPRLGLSRSGVRILAILGHPQGINLEADRQVLERLPHAEVKFLVEPSRQQVSDRLWEQPWDILFFAGHSETEEETGRIYINPTDSFSLSELKHSLQKAIDQGLQLAIFNSCDGLGLARELQPLAIAQMIVMREPVTDHVAQTFLRYFLDAFASGESLYLATRHARERLQGLEDHHPCASWLPVIYQHPLMTPPDWDTLRSSSDIAPSRAQPKPGAAVPVSFLRSAKLQKRNGPLLSRSVHRPFPKVPPPSVAWTGMVVTLAVMIIRLAGFLQGIELAAYDQLMRARPAEAIDSRILVVEVTQEDVNDQGGYPLTDQALVETIRALQIHEPRAIALDMHRYQPRGESRDALIREFQQHTNLFLVCAFHDLDGQSLGQDYAAPPEFSKDQRLGQVGFSNFPVDASSTVRRHLLTYQPELATNPSNCTTPYSLSFQLTYTLLADLGIAPLHVNDAGRWQLGDVTFHPLPRRFGGYQNLNGKSDQVMLNYRSAYPGQRVSLKTVINGQLEDGMVRDRIVLIGYTAPVARDTINTPYGPMAGVWVHAHMTSQMVSAVLDDRPLIWVLPQWRGVPLGDGLWLAAWALLAGGIAYYWRSHPWRMGGAIALVLLAIYEISLLTIVHGGWLPLFPALLSVILVGALVVIVR